MHGEDAFKVDLEAVLEPGRRQDQVEAALHAHVPLERHALAHVVHARVRAHRAHVVHRVRVI